MVKDKKESKNMISVHEVQEFYNRLKLSEALGYQYAGKRDIYDALGYPKDTILFVDYFAKYRRTDIAKAVIDRPVSMTWKGPVDVVDSEDKQDELKDAWKDLFETLSLKSKFIKVDKLSCIGRYAILLLGFSDVIKADIDFVKPVQKSNNLRLLYVTPYSENSAVIQSYEENTTSSRYGLPLIYQITLTRDNSTAQTILVHHTRIIHITGDSLESDVFGNSTLEPIYNRLLDLEKIVGGSAEMYWRGARPGYAGKVDTGYKASPNLKAALDTQMEEYENNLRRIFINEGVDLKGLEQQFSDPVSHVLVQVQMISTITGIPMRILLGSERGELASGQDRDSWFDMIQMRREEYAEVQILWPFVDRMMEYGILPLTEEYKVEWSELYSASDLSKATIGKVRAEALKAYNENLINAEVIPVKSFQKHFLGFNDEQIEDIQNTLEEQTLEMDTEETIIPTEERGQNV